MTLDTMPPQERKRQGYIHELIHTEETYVEDLELVLEVGTDLEGNCRRPPGSRLNLSLRLSTRSSISRCRSQAA